MTITIHKELDDLFNILSSFHILVNYDYYKEQMEEKWNLDYFDIITEYAHLILNDERFADAHNYVGVHLETEPIFNNPMLQHESKDIHEYLRLQKEQSEDFLVSEIFKFLKLDDNVDNFELIEVINKKDVSNQTKCFYMRLIQSPKKEMNKFIEMMQIFIPIYEALKNELIDDFHAFVKWLDPIIQENPIAFIDEHIEFLNVEQYDNIMINYSLISLVSTQILDDKGINIYLGIMFKKYIDALSQKDDILVYTNIFKVLSDPTRFAILSLLAKEELYGQEIAERLNVSTATISYHMDFLFSSQLVTMKRRDRKIYYQVNRDNLNKSIHYLKSQFNL